MATPQISTRSITWSVITKVKQHKPSEFQSVLLAIAGHDTRQPLQVMPPSINIEMAKGFSLYMVKAIMSSRTDEIIDLAKTNLWR